MRQKQSRARNLLIKCFLIFLQQIICLISHYQKFFKIMGLQRNYIKMHYNLWKTGRYSIQTKTM